MGHIHRLVLYEPLQGFLKGECYISFLGWKDHFCLGKIGWRVEGGVAMMMKMATRMMMMMMMMKTSRLRENKGESLQLDS